MPNAVHVLVFEGFADWEPAHALAELRHSGKRDVVVVGFNPDPVTSSSPAACPEHQGIRQRELRLTWELS